MRLIVGDEHEMFADCLSSALEEAGHRVDAVATTPEDLVTAVRRSPPDASLFEVSYGSRLHPDLPEAVREASPDTRVVVMTGHQEQQLWDAYRAGSIDALVAKECGLATIQEALRRAVEGQRPVVGWERPVRRRDDFGVALTPRERDVVAMLTRGGGTAEIARALRISPNTLRTHVQHVMDKLGARSRVQLVHLALKRGLVDLEMSS